MGRQKASVDPAPQSQDQYLQLPVKCIGSVEGRRGWVSTVAGSGSRGPCGEALRVVGKTSDEAVAGAVAVELAVAGAESEAGAQVGAEGPSAAEVAVVAAAVGPAMSSGLV